VHRDFKPEHLKIRADGTPKVLDYGLAKAREAGRAGQAGGAGRESLSQAATITNPDALTQAGMIFGTPAYMSPEQACGKPVDKRADIWAFGCVLYEMLTGQRAFAGDAVSEVLASVLAREPDWARLPANTPRIICSLVQNCLTKNYKDRLGDIAGALFALRNARAAADDRAPAAAGANPPAVPTRPVAPVYPAFLPPAPS
jgi:serine/threonine protein kinase